MLDTTTPRISSVLNQTGILRVITHCSSRSMFSLGDPYSLQKKQFNKKNESENAGVENVAPDDGWKTWECKMREWNMLWRGSYGINARLE